MRNNSLKNLGKLKIPAPVVDGCPLKRLVSFNACHMGILKDVNNILIGPLDGKHRSKLSYVSKQNRPMWQ